MLPRAFGSRGSHSHCGRRGWRFGIHLLRGVVDVLLDDLRWGHGRILHVLLRLLVHVGCGLIHAHPVSICASDWRRRQRGWHLLEMAMLCRHDGGAAVLVLRVGRGILQGLLLELEGLRGGVPIFVVADGRRHAIELQTDASGARPSVRGRCIALDLAPAAAFACSHHCAS